MAFELKRQEIIRNYEATIIMHPEASEADQKALFKKNKTIIESFKGEVNHVETWGKRSLTNPIGKTNLGNYFLTTFKALPSAIVELERTMGINDNVLRFLNIKLEDNIDLKKHVEDYHVALVEAEKARKEMDEKASKKRAMMRKPG